MTDRSDPQLDVELLAELAEHRIELFPVPESLNAAQPRRDDSGDYVVDCRPVLSLVVEREHGALLLGGEDPVRALTTRGIVEGRIHRATPECQDGWGGSEPTCPHAIHDLAMYENQIIERSKHRHIERHS